MTGWSCAEMLTMSHCLSVSSRPETSCYKEVLGVVEISRQCQSSKVLVVTCLVDVVSTRALAAAEVPEISILLSSLCLSPESGGL